MMNFLKYFLFTVLLLITLIFILDRFNIFKIRVAKFDKKADVNLVNNSPRETLELFTNSKNSYQGKVIFFNSWASWCGPCISEIPILKQIRMRYSLNPNIVFVSDCSDLNDIELIKFLKKNNLNLSFDFVESQKGLRLSLISLAINHGVEKDTMMIDRVPLNLIIDSKDRIVFSRSSLSASDTVEIYNKIDSLLKNSL